MGPAAQAGSLLGGFHPNKAAASPVSLKVSAG
jgi:hypothetical protein